MRRQLLLVISTAVLGAAVVAASAVAGAVQLGAGGADVSVDLPGGSDLPPVQAPACSNLKDDDGDGAVDLSDPGCSGPLDTDESNPAPAPPEPPPSGGGGGGGGGGGSTPPPSGGGGGGGGGNTAGGTGVIKGPKPDRGGDKEVNRERKPMQETAVREPDGTPTDANPTVTVADFGAAPIGVPNFVIDQFTIPPFLLPIYQACGTEYGVPWQVLASINRIETAFGTNLNVSSAGALGWMQFIPSSWEAYGVDANNDGRKDPYNPVDAICAAGRYLKAAGAQEDLPGAIFAYNHADWYVDEVILYARQYGRIPGDLVSSLTGLTEGARFPVAASARYADDISEREALARAKPGKKAVLGNAADVISSSPTRRGINIYSRKRAPVVAVNDGVVKEIGRNDRLGRYLILEDAYGNRFTYAQLGSVAEFYPVPKRKGLSAKDFKLIGGDGDAAPKQPASKGGSADRKAAGASAGPVNTEDSRERLYALPERRANLGRADLTGQLDQLLAERFPGYDGFKAYFGGVLRFDSDKMEMEALHEGSKVVAGTVLGRVGEADGLAPHVHFAIRPAGRGAPKIDPKPILDGWKLLESTAIYRAAGKDPFKTNAASVGQVLLMSKEQLIKRVLNDARLEFYSCGRTDVQTGQIDRRVMAMLAYLAERGFRLTITSLKCGRTSSLTSSGNVSQHTFGSAVDIAQVNGMPLLGNQGPGSVGEALVREILKLQGNMTPDQVISLMSFGGPSFAMADHADHVHVGYAPESGPGSPGVGKQFTEILKPDQWQALIDRIADIDNPRVPTSPSRYSLPAKGKGESKGKRASGAHIGE